MRSLPLHDASAPIACTLARDEVPDRMALLGRLRDHLVRLDRGEHGLVLSFPHDDPEVEADVRRFAEDEARCCRFWGFEVRSGTDGLVLRWDGPPGAAGLLAALADHLQGGDPPTDLAGLL
ncbi:MAG: hypothetical protein AB7L84_16015 [Acidimicrobiia bacterium]